MPNITISIEGKLLTAGREYAKNHHISLNALIRKLLMNTVVKKNSAWLEECFELMDKAAGNSEGQRWTRQELYDG